MGVPCVGTPGAEEVRLIAFTWCLLYTFAWRLAIGRATTDDAVTPASACSSNLCLAPTLPAARRRMTSLIDSEVANLVGEVSTEAVVVNVVVRSVVDATEVVVADNQGPDREDISDHVQTSWLASSLINLPPGNLPFCGGSTRWRPRR